MIKKISHNLFLLISLWSKDKVSTYAASLAYYTIFSLTPFIVLCTSIMGLAFGHDLAQESVLNTIALFMGKDSANQIHTMILYASHPLAGIITEIISISILIVGASGMFHQMQLGLNEIWGVRGLKKNTGFVLLIKKRLLSFIMMLIVAILLLSTIIFSIFLTFIEEYTGHFFYADRWMTWGIHSFLFISGICFLFALIFKILPDVKLTWSDVFFGSFVTAVLFSLGKSLLSSYLGALHVENAYGPAGSFIVILIWIYYSAQILFIGAEITKIQVIRKDKKVIPFRDGILVRKFSKKIAAP